MQLIHFLFAFLFATAMALPVDEQPSNKLNMREKDDRVARADGRRLIGVIGKLLWRLFLVIAVMEIAKYGR
ncbi:uncharacterized protein N7484_008986 [Penicillium longicatenatum]|uniref:uncharacterized protein n=1 Tax=Penicillium longicatenatum TaxID=1561947 RepID=UPI0025497ADC|nr:uncharacterized protein N7484_008986 [Penicillium longicatenatum]KAJ5635673.1 hypothetical protein N7484_008986 [Penicillium longicatenatum]